MDIHSGLFYLFAVVSTLYVAHFGLYLIGANFYDIWQYRRRQRTRFPDTDSDSTFGPFAGPGAASAVHYKPEVKGLVSVCIAAHNEAAVIVRTLESVRQSIYSDIEVLVADNASHDETRELVRKYARRHHDMKLRVYRMRRNLGKGGALNTLLRRYARGEFVMTLDADSMLAPDAIANTLDYFKDPKIVGVAANVQIIDNPTVLGTLQKFEHMVGYRSKKTYSVLNCEFVVGGVASTYRMRTLREVGFYDTDTVTEDIGLSAKIVSRGNRENRIAYAADVVAQTDGVASFGALARQRYRWKYGALQALIKHHRLIGSPNSRYSASLTMYRMPLAVISEFALLFAPLMWSYVLYITLTQYDPRLILGAYLTITAYVLVILWFDENLSVRARLRLSVYAPIMYFIFYVMDLVQLVAMVRCVGRSRTLVTQKGVDGTWVSPKRAGKQLVGT